MKQHPALLTSSHGTGDLNLASACMAIGIPLDERQPCAVIHSDQGRSYGRFFLGPLSDCGKFETMSIMQFWTFPEKLAVTNHPFRWMLDFIAARPHGCSSHDDWIHHAHTYLAGMGITGRFPSRLAGIPDFVATCPDTREAHLFAFVHCRHLCQALFAQAKAQVFMTGSNGHAIIDSRLPAHLRNNLIARLDG